MIVQGRQPVQVSPPVNIPPGQYSAGMARIGLGESAGDVLAASAFAGAPPATSTGGAGSGLARHPSSPGRSGQSRLHARRSGISNGLGECWSPQTRETAMTMTGAERARALRDRRRRGLRKLSVEVTRGRSAGDRLARLRGCSLVRPDALGRGRCSVLTLVVARSLIGNSGL